MYLPYGDTSGEGEPWVFDRGLQPHWMYHVNTTVSLDGGGGGGGGISTDTFFPVQPRRSYTRSCAASRLEWIPYAMHRQSELFQTRIKVVRRRQ